MKFKSQNITYKAIAKHLGLSEASVKRIFSKSQLTLERIDEICELLGIESSYLQTNHYTQFYTKKIVILNKMPVLGSGKIDYLDLKKMVQSLYN
jgi:transcriptional regulator with XRE-family HTH domain